VKPAANWIDALSSDRLLAEFSLWSADLANLASEMERVERFVDIYHIDVADGHFSPVLLYFPDLVAALRKHTPKPFHVHLMTTDDILLAQIEHFAEAGADLISIHAENQPIDEALALIERLGLAAGIVVQLHTPVAAVAPYLDRIRILTFLGTRIGVVKPERFWPHTRMRAESSWQPTAAFASIRFQGFGAQALRPSSWDRSPSTRTT